MAGDIKIKYASSADFTVTNLHSLAASSTWVAGWTSNTITNSNPYSDYLISGTLTSHASNRQAGSIFLYVVSAIKDTPTFPAVSSGTLGTEGAVVFADSYRRDAICRPLWSLTVDSTASAVYAIPMLAIASLFRGRPPTHYCLFLTHNIATSTNAGLAASGSVITYTPVLDQYT